MRRASGVVVDDAARDASIAAHARFKDGTIKHACFAALYAAGAGGLTVRARARGCARALMD